MKYEANSYSEKWSRRLSANHKEAFENQILFSTKQKEGPALTS